MAGGPSTTTASLPGDNERSAPGSHHRGAGSGSAGGSGFHARDVNGIYYINANLPAPQSALKLFPEQE